jgi:hypothetical protein
VSEPNVDRWVQLPLFGVERPEPSTAEPPVADAAPTPAPRPRAAYRTSHVRVTSDDDVVRSSDQSSRLSAEITWQLARSLTDEQLAEIRAKLGHPTA